MQKTDSYRDSDVMANFSQGVLGVTGRGLERETRNYEIFQSQETISRHAIMKYRTRYYAEVRVENDKERLIISKIYE